MKGFLSEGKNVIKRTGRLQKCSSPKKSLCFCSGGDLDCSVPCCCVQTPSQTQATVTTLSRNGLWQDLVEEVLSGHMPPWDRNIAAELLLGSKPAHLQDNLVDFLNHQVLCNSSKKHQNTAHCFPFNSSIQVFKNFLQQMSCHVCPVHSASTTVFQTKAPSLLSWGTF